MPCPQKIALYIALVILALFPGISAQASDLEEGIIHVESEGKVFMHLEGLPKFSDYPAIKPFSGKRATDIDFSSHPRAHTFRTRLRTGLKEEPNLAGHYRVVIYGCGTSCQQSFILDLETGKVFDGFGSGLGSMSKAESNLIIINPPTPPLNIPEALLSWNAEETFYYVWENQTSKLLKKITYTDYFSMP